MGEVQRDTDEVRLVQHGLVQRIVRVDRAQGIGERVQRIQLDAEGLDSFMEHAAADFARRAQDPSPRCDFCDKSSREVAKLIAGPTTYICNECVELCHEIVHSG